jgi:hypothetical protein
MMMKPSERMITSTGLEVIIIVSAGTVAPPEGIVPPLAMTDA